MTDPWLLPTRQRELPTREALPPVQLHARRESTFLVLSGTFLVATTAMLLSPAKFIDVTALIADWTGLAVDNDMLLAFGALGFPLAALVLALVRERYGMRRALALLAFGAVACLALVGLAYMSETLETALAFTACYLVGCGVMLVLCSMSSRHFWLRATFGVALAASVGFTAAAGVGYANGGELELVTSQALGALAFTGAFTFVALVPLVIADYTLAIYLRVGPDLDDLDEAAASDEKLVLLDQRKRQPALLVEDEPRRRPARPSLHPYSSAEMRFFTEGDTLAEADSSAPGLPAVRA